MSTRLFTIGARSFRVVRAELAPFVTADQSAVAWGVEVAAVGEGADVAWEPELTADRLVTTAMGAIRRWRDVAPAEGSWSAASASPEASVYVHEHSAVRDASWSLRREGGDAVVLRLTGRLDVDAENRDAPLHVEVPLGIAPWAFGRVTERACREVFTRTGLEERATFRNVRGVAYLVLDSE